MHKLDEIALISLMASALRKLSASGLSDDLERRAAYCDMRKDVSAHMSGWQLEYLDKAALAAETARRRILVAKTLGETDNGSVCNS